MKLSLLSLEVLVLALKTLHEEAKPMGIQVPWANNKVQALGHLMDDTIQFVHAPNFCTHPFQMTFDSKNT